MNTLTSILVIVLSIGLTQGVIFSIILWRKSDEARVPNRFKAVLLIILSYELLNQVLRLYGIGYYDLWYHLTLDLSWSYGPLLFLYVKAQVTPYYELRKKDYWIMAPILIQIICSIYVRSQNFFWDGTRDSLSLLGYYGYIYWRNYSTVPIIASVLIIYFSYRSLKLLNKLDADDVDEKNFRWVQTLVRIFGSYYILVLLILSIDLMVYVSTVSIDYYYFTRFYYYPFFIGIAILIYWFGISSIVRSDQRVVKARKEVSASERKILISIAETLENQMQEAKVYKDPDLTLNSLAGQLAIKPYLLTKTLNEIINKSFSDYVNEYRTKEIKELIKNPSNDKYTLLTLAFQAGFNSKSSFNRAVKKHLGLVPSDLKRKK